MGLLKFFQKPAAPRMLRLPSGSFTLDRQGRVIASTLPQSFSTPLVREIGNLVQSTFRSAREANLPLNELIVTFSAIKIVARDLRGGALIFLSPQGLGRK
jgi:hypothetical protein